MLSREEIKQRLRGPIAKVNVPEWGGEVGIRRLSAADLMKLRAIVSPEGKDVAVDDLMAACELLAMVICDDDGAAMFIANDFRDWDAQQSHVLQSLVVEAQKHNGIGEKAVVDLEKNSESGQTSVST